MIIHFDLLDSQMHYYNRKSGKRRARASFVRTIKKKTSKQSAEEEKAELLKQNAK